MFICNIGLSLLQSLGSTESGTSVELHYQNKYYALAATAALIQYLQFSEGKYSIPFCMKLYKFYLLKELLCRSITSKKPHSLYLLNIVGGGEGVFSLCLISAWRPNPEDLIRSKVNTDAQKK